MSTVKYFKSYLRVVGERHMIHAISTSKLVRVGGLFVQFWPAAEILQNFAIVAFFKLFVIGCNSSLGEKLTNTW